MNIAPPVIHSPSTTGGDTQGMHRRLLQDLERQWLDAWRVADQAQGDEGTERPVDPRPTSALPRVDETAPEATLMNVVPGMERTPQEQKAVLGEHDASLSVPSHREETHTDLPIAGSFHPGGRVDAASREFFKDAPNAPQPATRIGLGSPSSEALATVAIEMSAPAPAPSAAPAPAVSTSQKSPMDAGDALRPVYGLDQASSLSEASPALAVETTAPSAVSTLGGAGAVDKPSNLESAQQLNAADDAWGNDPAAVLSLLKNVQLGNDWMGEPESALRLTASSAELRLPGQAAIEPSAHMVVSSPTKASPVLPGLQQVAARTSITDERQPGSAAASHQAKAPLPASDERGPQRIMLRELSDQEVLASMRDALLTPAQSQFAAQGLARALMEAGYARVQVVVNGKPALNTLTSSRADMGDQTAELPSTPDSQEKHHGHQFR